MFLNDSQKLLYEGTTAQAEAEAGRNAIKQGNRDIAETKAKLDGLQTAQKSRMQKQASKEKAASDEENKLSKKADTSVQNEDALFEDGEESAEFFNSDDGSTYYDKDDIDEDELINEFSVVKENFVSESLKPVFISLVNTTSIMNETKKMDTVCVSYHPSLENNVGGKEMFTGVVFLNETAYEDFSQVYENVSYDYREVLLEKVNNGMNANIAISQYVDLILHECFSTPVDKRVYSLFKGKTTNYNYELIESTLDKVINNAKPLNESIDFYTNGFNFTNWLKCADNLD